MYTEASRSAMVAWRTSILRLSHEDRFGNLFAEVDMELIADGVNPDAGAGWRGDLRWRSDDEEAFGLFGHLDETADVDVRVALRADVLAVIGDAPIIRPKEFLGFGDGGRPEFRSFSGREVMQVMSPRAMFARKGEPAIGLPRVDVLDEKNARGGRLLFRLIAKAALTELERFGAGGIAGAVDCQEKQQSEHA
jgi:hypothetical protein